MYLPQHFELAPGQAIDWLVSRYPLAQLVTSPQVQGVVCCCDPVPLMASSGVREAGALVGHVARANTLWRCEGPVLAIFTGPQAYITPSAYPSKKENHRVVPTFNYATVQVTGKLVAVHDKSRKLEIVSSLTDQFEASFSEPWSVLDAPANYIDAMLDAIVGIEIQIESVVGKFKLSQNRTARDSAGVRDYLDQLADDSGASEMLKLMKMISPNG